MDGFGKRKKIPTCTEQGSYECGFHLFKGYLKLGRSFCESVADSLELAVVKLKYRNILAKGYQGEWPCIVAEFICVEKPQDISCQDIPQDVSARRGIYPPMPDSLPYEKDPPEIAY